MGYATAWRRSVLRAAVPGTALLVAVLLSGCSVQSMVVNWVGDALSGGDGVFATEEDPQLIREALPFGLKTYESLLETSPEHEGLLLSAAKGFAAYAYLLTREADEVDEADVKRARWLRGRAKRLYLRGREFALRGVALNHPGFARRLRQDSGAALAATGADDVAFLYWAGATWAGAVSAGKDDLALLAGFPLAGALVRRSMELDETFGDGAAHEFFVTYEASRPGGSLKQARAHYEQALKLSGGRRLSVHLALAESVSVRTQNLKEFRNLLSMVEAMDLEKAPRLRLVNTLAQERAAWLRTRIPDLFLDAE